MTPQEIEKHFEDLEKVAEEALCDKQEIIDLDRKRNTNREALRQLKFNPIEKENNKNWICIGNMFLRLPKENIVKNIERGMYTVFFRLLFFNRYFKLNF